MKQFKHIFVFLIILILLTNCHYLDKYEKGNGNIITKRIAVDDFVKIAVGGNFEVSLKHSDTPYVKISADENLMQYIDVDSDPEQNILRITQSKNLISRVKLKADIYYTHLEGIRISGAALVENEGIIRSEALELKLEGAGVVKFKVECIELDASLSGIGIVELMGNVKNQHLVISGAGGLDAYGLESEECEIKVSGIGGAKVFVTKVLNARIEGLGGIKYIGNPEIINKEINGIGIIEDGTGEYGNNYY